jgi:Mlc titration factor MtfA (ptsG expression regulator)
MFGWLRRRGAARPIPDALWQAVLDRYPFLSARPQDERSRLRELAAQFLDSKEFHGARASSSPTRSRCRSPCRRCCRC